MALRRFFDDSAMAGGAFHPGSAGEVDQRVLTNTIEQLVLAIVLWPFVALTLGALVVLYMGVGFAIARLVYWAGYHLAPPLRTFGFGATFFPTVLGFLWAVMKWAV
ncbi:MAPEG family protein [Rhodobacteraceae bacterium D3-12]|nr:MAPEG family protein [Rhodobacteraceae bacterium D3-12]